MRVILSQYEEKMQKSLDNLEAEYATIRAGRANPNILNKLRVEYYGVPTPMQQLANITVPEARTLMIAPWEPSLVKEIEKAIMNSDIGITPNNDGRNIILNFPELTEQMMLSRRWRRVETSARMSLQTTKIRYRSSQTSMLDR